MIKSSIRQTFLLFLLFAPLGYSAMAQVDSVNWARRFVREMNRKEHGMYDYTERYLNQLIAKAPPEERGLLQVLLADTYIAWNKIDEAEKIIAKIPQSDQDAYAEGQLVLGKAAIHRNRMELGIQALERYISFTREKYKDTRPDDSVFSSYREAIGYLKFAYEKMNQIDKVNKLMAPENLQLGPKDEGDEGNDQGDRMNIYLRLMALLDGAESLKEQGKPAAEWQKIVNDTIKPLEDLRWVQDIAAAYSYPARARAFTLLGRYDDALNELNMDTGFIRNVDDTFRKQGIVGQAPGAISSYWFGRINQERAEKAKESKDKEKLYIDAFKAYFQVLRSYEGYRQSDDAFARMSECQRILKEEFSRNIRLPDDFKYVPRNVAVVIPAELDLLFKEGKFAQTIDPFLEIIRANRFDKTTGRPNPAVADVLQKLLKSFIETKKDLEAMATARYLASFHAGGEAATIALLIAGEDYWKRQMKDEAFYMYDRYLEIAPTHQHAPAIAFRVAKDIYDQAAAAAEQANKLPQGDERVSKREEAVELYKKAVPLFERVTLSYANTQFGANGFYLLALAYASSDQFTKAAETYLDFVERELRAEKPDLNRASDAKLRASQNFFQGGRLMGRTADALRERYYRTRPRAAAAEDTAEAGEAGEPAEAAGDLEDGGDLADVAAPDIPEVAAADVEEEVAGIIEAAGEESLLEEAAKIDEKAKEYYFKTIEGLRELFADFGKEGIFAAVPAANRDRTLASAYELVAWAYDAAGEKLKAAEAFAEFIRKYPQSPRVPACMMRQGVIYTELGDDANTEKVLGELVRRFPDSPEGKNATFFLARSLYNNRQYARSIEELQKMFAQKQEVSVANLRWIARNMVSFGGERIKEGAEIALLAGEKLLEELKKPNLEDWFGRDRARDLTPETAKRDIAIIVERTLYETSVASHWAGDHKKTVEYLTRLLDNPNTPYLYEARLLRSDAYIELKDYVNARADLSEVAVNASRINRADLYNQAQCRVGDTLVAENQWPQALAAFNAVAAFFAPEGVEGLDDVVRDGAPAREKTTEQQEAEREWAEYAVYMAVVCMDKIGNPEHAARKSDMANMYLKHFPNGRFVNEVRKLR